MDDVENEFDMLSDDESSASEEESDEGSDSDDDDGSGDEDITEEANGSAQVGVTSSDDNEQERCPVCLNRFIGQDLGTPESCEHTFCYDCIEEWSKNINTCPVDRNEFNYIYLRAVLGGSILQKIKVKLLPKEPEEALVESVTLCEVCRNGDREDRLLLCDGCDLAYHCECLDPPLFYIPIEEWFCPPCSGVLQNGAVAGPSRTRTRRIIPRTRASEAVRSRVQNLRTTGSSAPQPTTPWQRKTTTTQSPRKRKRRYYRKRAFKKVVTLARTKKDLNNAQKGKLATRSSAVIVTYRKRRKRRRKSRRKVSKRSAASSKVLPIPSSKQRIAQRLGISKPLQGSTVPQVKQSTKSLCATSRSEKLPAHSLFGNKHQLMDFSENFAEDPRNVPSTSTNVSSGRCSNALFSSTSSINILDSIMAGQKILHTKSDGIVIKTDGSLVLKEGKSNTKKITSDQKNQGTFSSHTPMSVALAKKGVKVITSNKLSYSSLKKHAEASKTKDIPERKVSKFSPEKKNSVIKSSRAQHVSRIISTNTTLIEGSSSSVVKYGDKEKFGKTLSMNVAPKQFSNRRISASKSNKFNSLSSAFQCNIPSDCETDLPNDNNKYNLKGNFKTEKQTRKIDVELETCSSTTSGFLTNKLGKCSYSVRDKSSSNMPNGVHTKSCIKKEILSVHETDCNMATPITDTIQIKQEVLSGEKTNTDRWALKNENQLHETSNSITNIKKEPVDPEANTLENNDRLNAQNATNYVSKNKKRSIKIKEEELSDTEECSQSLLLSTDTQNFMSCTKNSESYSNNRLNSHTESKIKKEAKEDRYGNSERDTTSCLGNASKPLTNDMSRKEFLFPTKISNHSLSENNLHYIQAKTVPTVTIDSENDDLPCTQAVLASIVIDSEDLPSTQAAATSFSDFEEDDIPCTQAAPTSFSDFEEDDIPCTQAAPSPTVMESEDDLPCSQAPHFRDSEDDDLPCTQAVFLSSKKDKIASDCNRDSDDDEDDLPCTQAVFLSSKKDKMSSDFNKDSDDDSDDNLPCTQAVFLSTKKDKIASDFNKDSDDDSDDDLPCTQAASLSTKKNTIASDYNKESDDDSDDNLPCTQAVFLPTKKDKISSDFNKDSDDDNGEDDLPCTQAVSLSTKKNTIASNFNKNSDDDDLPCTQAAYLSTENDKIASNFNKDSDDDDLPCTQAAFLSTKKDKIVFDFNKDSEDDGLPCTQAAPADIGTDSDNDDLPCTQAAPSLAVTDSEDDDLPYTQAAHASTVKDLEDNLPCTQAVFLPTQISNMSSKELNLPKTHESCILSDNQILCADSESFNLPPTQISNSVLRRQSDVSCDGKLINSANTCLDDKPENIDCNTNMEDILLNIKQLVNNLSVRSTEQIPIMEDEEASESRLSHQSNIAVGLTDSKGISEDFKSESSDSNNSKGESTENLHSSAISDNEELSHEKLVEIARKSKLVSPTWSGIHKNLPQVIATVPVKEHIKIKPTNKRTFSFEEVAKLEAPAVQKTSNSFPVKVIANNTYKSDTTLNISMGDSEDLPATQVAICLNKSTKSIKFSTLNNATSKNVKSEISLSNSEDNSLPATQIQQFGNENNFSNVQKNNKSHSDAINHKSSFFQTKTLRLEKSPNTLKSRTSILKSDIFDSTKESLNESVYLDDDLPATQLNNNVSISKLSNIFEDSNHVSKAVIRKSHTNNFPEKQMFRNKDVPSSVISKSLFEMKQHEESDTFKRPTPKRKCSIDDTLNQKKKHCNQNISAFQSKELQKPDIKAHRDTKASLEYQKPDKEFNAKTERKILSKNLKQETQEFNTQKLEQQDSKQKIKKDIASDTAKVKSEIDDKKQSIEVSHPATIKQEKKDFDFVKPSSDLLVFNSRKAVSLTDVDFVRIKSEDNFEDLLPATQAVNNDPYEDNLPATQMTNFHDTNINFDEKNLRINQNSPFLCPSKIKKEVCVVVDDDDDEVSIIQFVSSDSKIPKEIISLDDESEHTTLSNVRAKDTTPAVKNKKRKIENDLAPSRFISKNKTTHIANNESGKEAKHGLSKKEHKQKCNNNSEKEHKQKCNNNSEKEHKQKCNNNSEKEHKQKCNNNSEKEHKQKCNNNSEKEHKQKCNNNSEKEHKQKCNNNSEKGHKQKCNNNSEKEHKQKCNNNSEKEHKQKCNNNSEKEHKQKCNNNSEKEHKQKCNNNPEKELKYGLSKNKHNNNSEDSPKHFKKCSKDSKDLSIGKEDKPNDNLLKSTMASKNKKDSTNSSIGKNKRKHGDNLLVPKPVSLAEKPISKIVNNKSLSIALLKEDALKDPCNKERSRKEKENCRSLNNNTKNEVVITLKSKPSKRPHENLSRKDGSKKVKYDHSLDPEFCSSEAISNSNPVPSFQENFVEKGGLKKVKYNHSLDSESCSSLDISMHSFPNNYLDFMDANTNASYECDVINDSASTPRSDKGLENVNVLNTTSLRTLPAEEVKKVIKEDLKEEIANEVKAVLKPFFKTGLISKDDYKDIMRRAVPKIFMNCHNCINPEKIRKLVLSYVSLLSKS